MRIILTLSLATGLLGVNGYAQTVANLTTPCPAAIQGVCVKNGNVTLIANERVIVTGQNFAGTITNGGTITLNAGGVLQLGQLQTPAAVPPTITLTGGGPLTLAGGRLTGVVNNQGAQTKLTNINNTITGFGAITALSLNNQATINANAPGGTLTISASPIVNSGTLQANLGGTLELLGPKIGLLLLANQPNAAGQGGSLFSGQGGTIVLNRVAVTGGFLDTQGSGVINGAGVTLKNLTINGAYNLAANSTTTISGRVQNNGTISFLGDGVINGSNLINGNQITAAAGDTLDLANFTQTGGTLLADGSIATPMADIEGGLITGTGSLTGTLAMGGTFQPGDNDAPGIFSVIGQYNQGSSGILDELLGPGAFSQTLITGSSTLAGLLDVALYNGFQPDSSNVFPIMLSTSGFSGYFADAVPTAPGLPGLLSYSGGTFDVNYNVSYDGELAVTLSNYTPANQAAVPEPSSSLLFGTALVGFALIIKWGRRRIAKPA